MPERGERNPHARLTEAAVREIRTAAVERVRLAEQLVAATERLEATARVCARLREQLAELGPERLAEQYHVTRQTVWRAQSRDTWAHVE